MASTALKRLVTFTPVLRSKDVPRRRAQPCVAESALLGREVSTHALSANDFELRVSLEAKPSRHAPAAALEHDRHLIARFVAAESTARPRRHSPTSGAGHGKNHIVTFQARAVGGRSKRNRRGHSRPSLHILEPESPCRRGARKRRPKNEPDALEQRRIVDDLASLDEARKEVSANAASPATDASAAFKSATVYGLST